MVIGLPRAADAERPFDLEVELDRGVVTYPYALPREAAAAFLEAPLRGWGEAQNETSSPAYIEAAAIPSATRYCAISRRSLSPPLRRGA